MYQHYREVHFWCLRKCPSREVISMVSFSGGSTVQVNYNNYNSLVVRTYITISL